MGAIGTDGWYLNRTRWVCDGGPDGQGRFLRLGEGDSLVRQMLVGVYLAPDVTEEQLAPRRALLRGDGLSDAAPVVALLALGAQQYELEVERSQREEERRRQKVRARREVRRDEADEADEILKQILQPEPPVEVKEEPAVEIVAAVPIEVEALMVEEVPATVAAVAEDPNVVEARKRVERLRQTAAWNRLIPDQQCEVGALLVTDAVAAAERLADYIAAAVERPKPSVGGAPAPEAANTCARRGCSSPVWDEKGPFKDAHGVGERDDQIRWAHGKFFCYRCRGELIARVKNLLAQRAQAAPPLERPPEPLVAMAAAEERAVEVQPAAATATA